MSETNGRRSRFVTPTERVIPISDGDTITVRRRLSIGEQFASYERMYEDRPDGQKRVNPLQTGIAMVTAYLLDWTLTDDQGATVPIRNEPIDAIEAAVSNLYAEDFEEIKAAIEAHEAEMVAERARQKKVPVGDPVSSAT